MTETAEEPASGQQPARPRRERRPVMARMYDAIDPEVCASVTMTAALRLCRPMQRMSMVLRTCRWWRQRGRRPGPTSWNVLMSRRHSAGRCMPDTVHANCLSCLEQTADCNEEPASHLATMYICRLCTPPPWKHFTMKTHNQRGLLRGKLPTASLLRHDSWAPAHLSGPAQSTQNIWQSCMECIDISA